MGSDLSFLFGRRSPGEAEGVFTGRRRRARKYLEETFDRDGIGILWSDTFAERMNDQLPTQSKDDCIVALLVKVDRELKHDLLVESLRGEASMQEAKPTGGIRSSDLTCLCDRYDQDEFLIDCAASRGNLGRPFLIVIPGPRAEAHDLYLRRFRLETSARLQERFRLPGQPQILVLPSLGKQGDLSERFCRQVLEQLSGTASASLGDFITSELGRHSSPSIWAFLDLSPQQCAADQDLIKTIAATLSQLPPVPAGCSFGVVLAAQIEPPLPFWSRMLSRHHSRLHRVNACALKALEDVRAVFAVAPDLNYWHAPDLVSPEPDDVEKWLNLEEVRRKLQMDRNPTMLVDQIFATAPRLPMSILDDRLRNLLAP